MRINGTNQDPIKLDNEDIENFASFTYLRSVIAVDGGTERDVLARIGKARTALLLLRPVWRSKTYPPEDSPDVWSWNLESNKEHHTLHSWCKMARHH